MESRFQTSFIPKKPVVSEQARKPKVVNLFAVLGTVVFILMVVASAGTFFYKSYLAKTIDASKNQLEAWKFLKFLSEKENLTKLYEIESKTRLFGEPYSRMDLAGNLSSNEYVGVVADQAKNFISLPVISRTYDKGLNDEVIQNIENAINATINGVSYTQALVEPKKGIDQVFKRFNIE